MINPFEAAQVVKGLAREQGFDLAGVAPVEPSAHGEAYKAWLAAGKHGAMDYLARGIEERLDLRKKLPWARSVVCVALAYFQEMPGSGGNAGADPAGKVARYAWGRDYHKVIEGKLRKLEKAVRGAFEGRLDGEPLEIRTYCDTGPILERELAARAGMGWIGKNTLLLHPRHGSYFVLGELITSVRMRADEAMGQHCGTCTRCIDACPTEAITPWSVNGVKCISYQTLENRGPIDERWHEAMQGAGYVVGCDICQEVCPFNRQPLVTREADFAVREPAPAVGLREILAWEEQAWDKLTRGRALRRAKFEMWKRNARVLLGEARSPAHAASAQKSDEPLPGAE